MPRGRAIAGFHVEGPHIGPEDGPRGAHPAAWVRPPDLAEFARWQDATDGNIRLVTLSPHWPEAPGYIAALRRRVLQSASATPARTAEQIAAAVEAGATLSTHLGNAAHGLLPKFPNYLLGQMADDRLSASFIVDGIHLDDSFLRMALRAKRPATHGPGDRRSRARRSRARPLSPRRELDADLTPDGRVVLAGTAKLAGSALRMDRALTNMMRIGNITLRDALQTATTNPARLIHLEGRMQGLTPGDRADIVVFRMTEGIEIEAVYLDGERVA